MCPKNTEKCKSRKGQVKKKEKKKIILSEQKQLKKGKLNPEIVEKTLEKVKPEDQMLLLNLLGGRLPLGYRMAGDSAPQCAELCMAKLDRVLRRIRRVAEQLEKSLAGE